MRRGTLVVQMGRFARHGLRVVGRAAAVFCAALVLAAPALGAQGTPAGTVIRSWASVSFTIGGFSYTYPSDTADLVVAQVGGADVEPPRVSSGAAGTTVLFAHTLTNVGNGVDSFDLAAASVHGWPVTLYHDANSRRDPRPDRSTRHRAVGPGVRRRRAVACQRLDSRKRRPPGCDRYGRRSGDEPVRPRRERYGARPAGRARDAGRHQPHEAG